MSRNFNGFCPNCGMVVHICCSRTECDFCSFNIIEHLENKKKKKEEFDHDTIIGADNTVV